MFPVLTNKACIGWLWCHVSEVTFISALMLICSIYLMEHYLWVHCMYAWICSLCRSYDSVSAWRCSRTRQHRECFTESASAFAVRAVKAWCALVTVCVQTECQPGEASVMSPALAHFTVCVRLQPPLLVSHVCSDTQVLPVGHEQLRQTQTAQRLCCGLSCSFLSSLWWSCLSLPLHRASTQQYCFVLLCAWGVMKSFVFWDTYGYV